MGWLDRLFGTEDARERAARMPQSPAGPRAAASASRDADGRYAPPPATGPAPNGASAQDADQQAIERYRYLLRTAPPETIEQVHAEAFGRLTDAQRQQVLADLSATLPPAERPRTDDPRSLARAATRAEYTQPGFMERTFGGRSFTGGPAGPGFGSMLGASMLGTIGGYVIGSALVGSFFAPALAYDEGYQDGSEAGADGTDAAGDAGGFGDVGGDFGGDFGGF